MLQSAVPKRSSLNIRDTAILQDCLGEHNRDWRLCQKGATLAAAFKHLLLGSFAMHGPACFVKDVSGRTLPS